MKIFLKDIKERFPEFEIKNYDENAFFTGFSHDTREKLEGTLYIPIVGERFDGHTFIIDALNGGAFMSLCENSKSDFVSSSNKPIILADSIEEGLQKILNFSISSINAPRIAITGSTGKTTTKKMLVKILETKKKVLWSDYSNTVWGNAVLFGNYVDEDIIVLECAMDRKGEIAWHVNSTDPDLGILLNIGYVHAEKVGDIEEVYKEKKDLADYMRKTGKPLILNIDDERLLRIYEEYVKDYELITFGKNEKADFCISDVYVDDLGTHFKFKYYDNVEDVNLKVFGEGFVYDAMAAIIAGNKLNFSIEECVRAVEDFVNENGRFQKLEYGNNVTIINDAYNANPDSMKMALETFKQIYRDKYYTIAVLGDMKELGTVSESKHKEIAELIKECNFNEVFYIGENFRNLGCGEYISSADEVAAMLNSKFELLNGRKIAVLLKGSNSLGLYQVPDFLKKLGTI